MLTYSYSMSEPYRILWSMVVETAPALPWRIKSAFILVIGICYYLVLLLSLKARTANPFIVSCLLKIEGSKLSFCSRVPWSIVWRFFYGMALKDRYPRLELLLSIVFEFPLSPDSIENGIRGFNASTSKSSSSKLL